MVGLAVLAATMLAPAGAPALDRERTGGWSATAHLTSIRTPALEARRTAPGVGRLKPGSVSISFVGDTILGDTPDLPPRPARYLDPVLGSLDKAQIVLGNLE